MEEKKRSLISYIAQMTRGNVALAFSGGVDSALLLKLLCEAAKENHTEVYAITIQTRLHPAGDLPVARQVAEEMGAHHLVIEVDELLEAGIEDNPIDRCYRCKKCLFQKVIAKAKEVGATFILDGTNADDLTVYRPGIKALRELGIESPLAVFGFSKEEVRALAKEYEVSVASRPSTPCMATRLPYGASISYELLAKLDEGERWFREQGYYNVRLRFHDPILRIEVDADTMVRLVSDRFLVISRMKEIGFFYITLDLEGFRSGSMDLFVEKSKYPVENFKRKY